MFKSHKSKFKKDFQSKSDDADSLSVSVQKQYLEMDVPIKQVPVVAIAPGVVFGAHKG